MSLTQSAEKVGQVEIPASLTSSHYRLLHAALFLQGLQSCAYTHHYNHRHTQAPSINQLINQFLTQLKHDISLKHTQSGCMKRLLMLCPPTCSLYATHPRHTQPLTGQAGTGGEFRFQDWQKKKKKIRMKRDEQKDDTEQGQNKSCRLSPLIPSDLLHFRGGAAQTRGTVRQISDPPLLQDRVAVSGCHTQRERER